MKTKTCIALGAVAAITAGASADMVSFDANIANFGALDDDGSGGTSAAVIWETTFALPAIDSIDSVSFELAHSYLSDMDLRLVAPNGDEFLLALGEGPDDGFDGGFDGSDLGDGGSELAGVANYIFAEAGSVWNGAGDPVAGDTFAALTWQTGGWAAGDWTLTVIDAWDTGDDGALGGVAVAYTVPGPGALALLGLAGVAGRRRRRG